MPEARLPRRATAAPVVLFVVVLLTCLHRSACAQTAPAVRSRPTPPSETTDGSLIARSLPRVVYRGGLFLRRPRIVTITFIGDDPALVSRLERFGDTIIHTDWWRAVTEGYCAEPGDCVGEGQTGSHVRLAVKLPAAVRDADVEALLARELKAHRFGPTDPDTLLLVYLPGGITLSNAFVPHYCSGGPRALHRALRMDQDRVAYAILPRCGDEAELTAAASHEILEAVTNPDPSRRGFAFEQGAVNLGFTAAGVEPVDPCGLITMDGHRTTERGFVVQRAWSNRAASLGRDPCVPARVGRPYVTLVPREPTVRLPREGMSSTIALEAAADRTVPGWAVSAFDLTGYQDGEPCVEVSLDRSQVVAGQTLNLTITARKRNARRLCIVGVVSTLGVHSYMWPVAVVMR